MEEGLVTLPLNFIDGHLFARVDGADWLLDTGAPASFGALSGLKIGGQSFEIADSYMGLNPATLSEYVGHPTAGIIGADVLGTFDTLFDVPGGTVSFSVEPMEMAGEEIETRLFMGIPTVEVAIAGANSRSAIVFPSVLITTSRTGRSLPAICRASRTALSMPVQQGTSM